GLERAGQRVEDRHLLAHHQLHQAEQRAVAPLRHELRVQAEPPGLPGGLREALHQRLSHLHLWRDPTRGGSGRATAFFYPPMGTGVPTGPRGYRSRTSGTVIRMQPCDAALPIDSGMPVPWMPTPLTMPIQRALSGFSAEPPATDSLR